MFLKNVPPAVAMHTEWRSYGPARVLPSCFKDPAGNLSTAGKAIPEKVQMIIDSLRSSNSSLAMNDENNGTRMPVDTRATAFGVTATQFGPKARQRSDESSIKSQKRNVDVLKSEPQSHSDSDDSVDRGIEEAIQEYLKKKEDYKQDREPSTCPLEVPKQLKRSLPVSDLAKYSDSNKVLTVGNYVPKSYRCTRMQHTEIKLVPSKKLERIPELHKVDMGKTLMDKNSIALHSSRSDSPSLVQEEGSESSSDDGIEEEICRYQLEMKKKHEENARLSKLLDAKEQGESSSDDGIEEAIRDYQLQKQKEERENSKNVPKLPLAGKALGLSADQVVKKQKVLTKSKKNNKLCNSPLPSLVPASYSFKTPFSTQDLKVNMRSSAMNNSHLEVQTPSPIQVNRSAELMCAEAILDISKAVMPGAFSQPPTPCVLSAPLTTEERYCCTGSKSDASSIDSDDGIEQEIRKFLELKAQMRKQQPEEHNGGQMVVAEEKKPEPTQITKTVLPVPHKRKCKEEELRAGKEEELRAGKCETPELKIIKKNHPMPLTTCERVFSGHVLSENAFVGLDLTTTSKYTGVQKHNPKKRVSLTFPESTEGASPSCSSRVDVIKSCRWNERREASGDKSSSLDSDEDLEAAIKDLLKTKRRVKKSLRDKRLKSRKIVNSGASNLKEESEKNKIISENRTGTSPKTPKNSLSKDFDMVSKNPDSGKRKISKSNSDIAKSNKKVKHSLLAEQIFKLKGVEPSLCSLPAVSQKEEDSSSVDSDDSIEQEIRKFLAEKAKVTTVDMKADEKKDGMGDTIDSTNLQCGDVKAPLAKNTSETCPHGPKSTKRCWEIELVQSTSPSLYNSTSNKFQQADWVRDDLSLQKWIPKLEPEWEGAPPKEHLGPISPTALKDAQSAIPSTDIVLKRFSSEIGQVTSMQMHAAATSNLASVEDGLPVEYKVFQGEAGPHGPPQGCYLENMCQERLTNPTPPHKGLILTAGTTLPTHTSSCLSEGSVYNGQVKEEKVSFSISDNALTIGEGPVELLGRYRSNDEEKPRDVIKCGFQGNGKEEGKNIALSDLDERTCNQAEQKGQHPKL